MYQEWMLRGEGSKGENDSPSSPIWKSPIFTLDSSPIPLLLTSSQFDAADKIDENFHFKFWVERPCFNPLVPKGSPFDE